MEAPPPDGPKGRNLVIFSDGTGQRGGVYFDEARTNIYKLYRAARCASASLISHNTIPTQYDDTADHGTSAHPDHRYSGCWARSARH